jgi:O-methyltransferase
LTKPPLGRRALRAAGRAVSQVSATQGESADLEQLRSELQRTTTEVRRLNRELKATRDSLRDPFPDTVLDRRVRQTIAAVREEKLSYLSGRNLAALARIVTDADRAGRPGLVVETGTALGGSAIVLGAAKAADRRMKVYDVFGQIPPPTEQDGQDVWRRYDRIVSGQSKGPGGEQYYGYRDNLYQQVTDAFARHGVPVEENSVDLVPGLFKDTIDLDEPVVFAHLDGDWYESTMTCLQRIAPLLVVGGRLVVDDYYAWSGCQAAVDEYFADRSGFRLERRSRLHVVRV